MRSASSRKPQAAVYFVKGSRVPVEALDVGSRHDSRFYHPSRRNRSSTELGNPSLIFMLNWQAIPPLSRLAVLQRAQTSNRAILPAIREVPGQEGGDFSHRDDGHRRPQTANQPGRMATTRMTEGDRLAPLARSSAAFEQRPVVVSARLTTKPATAVASLPSTDHRSVASSPCRRTRSQC